MYEKYFKINREKIESRIKEISKDFPETVLIDTVSYCNLKCSMCPHVNMKRKMGFMKWELYEKIINEISLNKKDVRIWMTFFGEGFIIKNIDEYVKYAKDKGLKDVVMNSNGNLINEKNAKKIISAGLDTLYVGIDAFTQETYSKFRVGGDLEAVVKNVIMYKEMLSRYGNKNQKIFVQYVVMEENKKELDSFIEFWKERDISIKIRPMVSWGGKVNANNLKNEHNDRLPCFWAMNTINIADDGKVCLCSVDLDCAVEMGDINKQTIKEVWNTSLKEFRDKHINGRFNELPEFCKNCMDWQSGYADYIENED